MRITHNVALNFHPNFNSDKSARGVILDFGFGIADLLNRLALSFLIKLIRRRRTLNPISKIYLALTQQRDPLLPFKFDYRKYFSITEFFPTV